MHVGQDDAPPALARRILGPDAIVGLSTHAPAELDAAADEPVDYVSAGPVEPTPTKPGRPGTGLDYVTYAAPTPPDPFFVTGGVTPDTVGAIAAAGARRFVVVRWLTEAADPKANARHPARRHRPRRRELCLAGLAVEPAEQDGDGPGVVAQAVAGAGEDAQLDRAVGGVGQRRGVEDGHDVVVAAVHEQQRPGRDLARRPTRRASPAARVAHLHRVGREVRRPDDADLAGVLEEPLRVVGPARRSRPAQPRSPRPRRARPRRRRRSPAPRRC